MSVTEHPSTTQLKHDLHARFGASLARHRRATSMMWAGFLMTQFTDAELSLLADRVSVESYVTLRDAGRNVSGDEWKWHREQIGAS